jgi:hypothetical protein
MNFFIERVYVVVSSLICNCRSEANGMCGTENRHWTKNLVGHGANIHDEKPVLREWSNMADHFTDRQLKSSAYLSRIPKLWCSKLNRLPTFLLDHPVQLCSHLKKL